MGKVMRLPLRLGPYPRRRPCSMVHEICTTALCRRLGARTRSSHPTENLFFEWSGPTGIVVSNSSAVLRYTMILYREPRRFLLGEQTFSHNLTDTGDWS